MLQQFLGVPKNEKDFDSVVFNVFGKEDYKIYLRANEK